MRMHLGLTTQGLIGAATAWVALNLILHSLSGIPTTEVEKLELLFGCEKAWVCGIVDALLVDAVEGSLAHGVVAGVNWRRH